MLDAIILYSMVSFQPFSIPDTCKKMALQGNAESINGEQNQDLLSFDSFCRELKRWAQKTGCEDFNIY